MRAERTKKPVSAAPEPDQVDIYLRLSSDPDDTEYGVDRQLDRCAKLQEARWTKLRAGLTHTDNDRGASDHMRKRPGFESLMARIEAGKVKVVIAWALDRLLRNRYDQVRLFEAAEKHGMVISLIEGSDIDMSTAAGQLVADILASQARAEIKLKSKRAREGTIQAASQGRRTSGRKPFGYEQDGMTLIPAEADAIRKAYDDLLAGVSLAAIAREWNGKGLYSGQTKRTTNALGPKGAPTQWSHDTVRLVLANPRNWGVRTYLKEEIAPAVWPAIVPEETGRAVLDILNNSERFNGGTGRAGQRLLTGVALCECGHPVHAGAGKSERPKVYRCGLPLEKKKGTSGHVNRKADPIDEWVHHVVCARLSRKDAAELLIDRAKPDIEALRARAVALRARLDGFAAEFEADEDGDITPSQFRIVSRGIQTKLAAVQAEMADAARVDLLGPLINSGDVEEMWHSEDFGTERQRAVIDSIMTVKILRVGAGVRGFDPDSLVITPKR